MNGIIYYDFFPNLVNSPQQAVQKARWNKLLKFEMQSLDLFYDTISSFEDTNESHGEIQNFWLTVLSNSNFVSQMVFENDHLPLSFLKDISLELTKDEEESIRVLFY